MGQPWRLGFAAATLVITAIATLALAQPIADGPVDAHAVWRPSQNDLSLIRKSCDAMSFPALGACFARGMQRAGASEQAVALTNRLHDEAYLHNFIESGRVD